jgi:hypothetical protein
MDDLLPFAVQSPLHIFPDFPVKGRFKSVFHCQGAAVYKK